MSLIIGICLGVGVITAILLAYFIAFQHGYLCCKRDLMISLATDQVAVEKIKAELIAIRLKELTEGLGDLEP
jgi:hypothetical protein